MNKAFLPAAGLLLAACPLSAATETVLFWKFRRSSTAEQKPADTTPPPAVKAVPVPQKPRVYQAPQPAVAKRRPSPEQVEANVRLQVFLDEALFCPGKIDGRDGDLVTRAILRYQRSRGLAETGKPDNLPLPNDKPFTEYTLRKEDAQFVGMLPSGTSEQSRRYYLPYSSYLEFLAERFHCAQSFLEEINPGKKFSHLRFGDTITVPAVEPFRIEELKSLPALPEVPEFKSRKIRILRKENVLELTEEEKLIAAVPITTGSASLPTPAGKWRILGISTLPTFRWDQGVLNHGVRTQNYYMLPPGPNNPVGVAWCGLNRPGIGIHGTNQPETISRAFSHGCIRVANWDVVRLIRKISAGISVEIE